MPEAVDHGRRQRQQPAPRRRPFDRLAPEAEAAAQLVDGPDVLDPRHRARRVVILQALADTRQRMAHLDAVRLQQSGRADARQLQQLRRVVGAAGEDDLLGGADLQGIAVLAAAVVAHADRALALEDDAGDMGMRAHIDIRTAARRMQERGRSADPAAV
ncbi:hypothetical protein chiPu_0033923, partial [Chiloscyllium punctatum]|nr:hypothetical protein [Chiloscyllium punctatum]